jgi:hypothetical protein
MLPVRIIAFAVMYITITAFQTNNYVSPTPEELKLYSLINQYRLKNHLPSIPLSPKLMKVAHAHCRDLYCCYDESNTACNPHSWSGNGNWTKVCYTEDHAEAEKMWSKPAEIAGYESSGYEIVHSHDPKDDACNAVCALNGWKSSPGHNSVIMNKGMWKNLKWKAIGVGIYKGFACVWFGNLEDK